ncbi:RdgB/HAM1 family non-canonical purine NTP pyrophosphatase [Patescibacteria group bacterium]|nr:RdgB/HAM1 family non-canonical purine NTP pyrophosphatase [Patescibacteria group bacterium]
MKILFASQNKGKQNEAKELFKTLDVELVFPSDFPELKDFDAKETGKTFIANAILKARIYSSIVNLPCIADDSGIIIDGMDGLPGIHSNRWFNGTSDERNFEVLKRLKNKQLPEERSARYLTAVCYYDPKSKEYETFEEIQAGFIGKEIIGSAGFDYDRIFIPEGYEKTFAQLGDRLKNQMSHRARAYKKIRSLIEVLLRKK